MYWATSTRLCKAVHEQNSVCWPSVEPHDMKPKATVNVTVTVTVIVTVAVNVHCHFAVSVGQKAMVQACRRGMQHVPGRGTGGHAHERWTDVGRGGAGSTWSICSTTEPPVAMLPWHGCSTICWPIQMVDCQKGMWEKAARMVQPPTFTCSFMLRTKPCSLVLK